MKQPPAIDLSDLTTSDIKMSLRRSSASMVESADHLQVLTELADVREKYYRLGAELRRLKQKEMHTSALLEEVETLRHLLHTSKSREEALSKEVRSLHQKLTSIELQYVEDLNSANITAKKAAARAQRLESEADSPWKLQELEGTVLHQKLEIQELKEEQDAIAEEHSHYKTLYEDMQLHCAQLEADVRKLRRENDKIKDENVSEDSLRQLRIDNRRLVLLLTNTNEFRQFKFYSTLEKVSYCSSESFGDDCSHLDANVDGNKEDSLAWGRLVSKMAQVYPVHSGAQVHESVNFQHEERQWIPTKILTLVSAFRREYAPMIPSQAFVSLLKKLNGVWQKSCQAKLVQITEANKREAAESHRRTKQSMPYDAVVHKREIHRLKQEILQLYNEKLQGRAVRAPESTRKLYSSSFKK